MIDGQRLLGQALSAAVPQRTKEAKAKNWETMRNFFTLRTSVCDRQKGGRDCLSRRLIPVGGPDAAVWITQRCNGDVVAKPAISCRSSVFCRQSGRGGQAGPRAADPFTRRNEFGVGANLANLKIFEP